MTDFRTTDFLTEVAKGNVEGHSIVHKFGRNASAGTSFVPITLGGEFRTPQVSGATQLRIKAGGDAADTVAGAGAQEVTLVCMDATGVVSEDVLVTAGTSASSLTVGYAIRVVRAYVSKSGTYATSAAGSHVGDIVIENAAGTEDWLTIDSTDFPRSQTEIGVYTVPLGFTAFLYSASIIVDSTKSSDLLFFKRENILETSAPYTAMRTVEEFTGLIRSADLKFSLPAEFPELTDIGFMGRVSTGTAEIDVDFELLLVDNNFL